MTLAQLLINTSLIFYAISAGIFLQAFPNRNKANTMLPAFAHWTFLAATAFISSGIALHIFEAHAQPLSGLILVFCISWITIFGSFFLSMPMTGTFVAPTCTAILLFYLFLTPNRMIESESYVSLASAHIFMAILGEAFAICACAISIVFLIQSRALKRKQYGWLTGSITPLDTLDRALLLSLWAGFFFITLGLISGAIYTQTANTLPKMRLTGKIIWALSVWLWYLTILLSRNIFKLSERRIAQMSMIGFLLLSISFFGLVRWGENP